MDAKQARALKHLAGPGGRTVRERYARGMRQAAGDGGPALGPGGRTVRERYARGMREAAADAAVARRGPVNGGAPVDFARTRIAVGRGFHN